MDALGNGKLNMNDLCNSTCEPCRVGAPPLSDSEWQLLSPQVPEWQRVDVDGVEQLQRVFRFANFVDALAFANRVGALAEEAGHHPALLVEWGSVQVWWWTHKIGGLHKNDVIMAARTDALIGA